MAERDPIDLIKGQLNRADEMAGLHAEHENFKDWHFETKTILGRSSALNLSSIRVFWPSDSGR